MTLDSLVTQMELSLLPLVRNEEVRLRTSGKFSEVRVVSLRHTDALHAMGITCRPVWASEKSEEHLSLTVVLSGFEGLSGRIEVQWSQTFDPRSGSGYLKKETGGFHGPLTTESEIVRFEKVWPRMFDLFVRVAARGKPSAYFLRRLRGASADQHGWKK